MAGAAGRCRRISCFAARILLCQLMPSASVRCPVTPMRMRKGMTGDGKGEEVLLSRCCLWRKELLSSNVPPQILALPRCTPEVYRPRMGL